MIVNVNVDTALLYSEPGTEILRLSMSASADGCAVQSLDALLPCGIVPVQVTCADEPIAGTVIGCSLGCAASAGDIRTATITSPAPAAAHLILRSITRPFAGIVMILHPVSLLKGLLLI